MNLLIVLAGVADPKWPLPARPDAAALAAHRAAHPLLSPFDEAALELALKWRDACPDTRLHALVGAFGPQDALLRHVAGYRLDQVEGLDLAAHPAWDAATLACRLAAWIAAQDAQPGLVLIGREFGDDDDGVVPALLAEACGHALVSQTLALAQESAPESWTALRQHGVGLERLHVQGPAVVAVTNHSGNRLRHPLLKNVMAARRAAFTMATLPPAAAAFSAGHLQLAGVAAAAAPRRDGVCRMLEGSPEEQAAQLARLLHDEAAA